MQRAAERGDSSGLEMWADEVISEYPMFNKECPRKRM
jgi:hypothetical protein